MTRNRKIEREGKPLYVVNTESVGVPNDVRADGSSKCIYNNIITRRTIRAYIAAVIASVSTRGLFRHVRAERYNIHSRRYVYFVPRVTRSGGSASEVVFDGLAVVISPTTVVTEYPAVGYTTTCLYTAECRRYSGKRR